MINQNDRNVDAEDVEVLYQGLSFMEAVAQRENRKPATVGFAHMRDLAERAAKQVALLHDDEGDEWDGVLWYERLEDSGADGLVARLFASDAPDVSVVVVEWLLSFGYVELTHKGKRWSFDSDELAEWQDGDEEGFHFLAYHGLVDPSLESITRFIDQL